MRADPRYVEGLVPISGCVPQGRSPAWNQPAFNGEYHNLPTVFAHYNDSVNEIQDYKVFKDQVKHQSRVSKC